MIGDGRYHFRTIMPNFSCEVEDVVKIGMTCRGLKGR
jgi:hypothetical protein